MVNASKILTVSYGTFSCTLEGFDDPFSTMRSIAEYFRDLAADDRYFGAEPPTPDADMLHRIAEREINRRVEAKVGKNGVVLRQVADDQSLQADVKDEVEPSQTATESLSLMAVSHVDSAGAAADPSDAADVDAVKMDAATNESVAEKLRRIRAAVARAHVEPQFTGKFAEDENANELFAARSIDAAFADSPKADEVDQFEPEAEEKPEDATAEATLEAETEAKEATAEDTPDVEADAAEAAAEDAAETEAEIAIVDEAPEIEADAKEPIVDDAPEVEVAEEVSKAAAQTDDEGFTPEAETAQAEDVAIASVMDAEDEDEEAEDENAQTLILTMADAIDSATEDALPAEYLDQAGEEAEARTDQPEEAAADDAAAQPDAAEIAPDQPVADLDIEGLTAMLAGEPDAAEPAAAADETVEAEASEEVDSYGAADESGESEEDAAATIEADETLEAEAPEADAPEAEAEDAANDSAKAQPVMRARVVKMRREDFLARFVDAEDVEAVDADTDEVDARAETPEAETSAPTDTSKADDKASPAKVTPDSVRASLGETGLSPEDEDDLIQELVAAERDAEEQLDPEPSTEEPAPKSQDDAPLVLEEAPVTVDETDEQDDATAETQEDIAAALRAVVDPVAKKPGDLSVDRLLQQADSELQDNDSSRRRSAIAHLKAAVAAVRADGGRAKDVAAAEEARTMDQFRNDLARVVRPEADDEAAESRTSDKAQATPDAAKPVAATDRAVETPRPRRKMPPLMLVSEQRVDKLAAADPSAEPVRPRRVQTDDETVDAKAEDQDSNIFGAADDFKGYVAETGAEGVQELLEASAAFGTLVEGQAFNSRPQIMQRMLRHVPEGTVTREEGLRAFGVLLREGRLIRIQRGQFVLPETSRFRAEQKSAAG